MWPYINFAGNCGGSSGDLEIQTFVALEIRRTQLKFSDFRYVQDIMRPYTSFDGNRRGSPWMSLKLKRTYLRK